MKFPSSYNFYDYFDGAIAAIKNEFQPGHRCDTSWRLSQLSSPADSIIANETFRLSRPMQTVLVIEASLADSMKNEAFIASLPLVTVEADLHWALRTKNFFEKLPAATDSRNSFSSGHGGFRHLGTRAENAPLLEE